MGLKNRMMPTIIEKSFTFRSIKNLLKSSLRCVKASFVFKSIKSELNLLQEDRIAGFVFIAISFFSYLIAMLAFRSSIDWRSSAFYLTFLLVVFNGKMLWAVISRSAAYKILSGIPRYLKKA